MTKALRQINDQLSTAGQPTEQELQQLAAEGFQSVLNLRTPGEANSIADEQQQVEAAGLTYSQVPLSSQVANEELVQEAVKQIQVLPKPILIHCAAGARATAIVLIALAIENHWTAEQLIQESQTFGIPLEQPHLQAFLQQLSVEARLG